MTRFEYFYNSMKRELSLQAKSEKTQEAYLRALRRIGKRQNKDLNEISQEDIKEYFYRLKLCYSMPSLKADRSGLLFFYTYVLFRDWDWNKIIRVRVKSRLPDILSQSELSHVFSYVNKWRFRVCLFTIYSMGLRISEALRIRPGDICPDRKLLHVRDGKTCRDRLVPIPDLTLIMINDYWLSHQNSFYIFPKVNKRGIALQENNQMSIPSVQAAFRMAVLESSVMKRLSVHSLRHSYATHLLESGVPILAIKEVLGHKSIVTTMVYMRLTNVMQENRNEQIRQLMSQYVFLNSCDDLSLNLSVYSKDEFHQLKGKKNE
ncbi:tyrosine-type recombinase/integrase [Lentisphaera profundi]|uniref:Tyrosine-type recombinase/integrase n=1 Tax=Lentisphaera profundi TaxID=1658616 RepID=A0ABY7W1B1_9BACT|nr:tyrosine-type recombinase/integrase [Lentisphaera profundi]WDE99263.1 tyrosine-type recombinase/integrase [Lentisphaera profundi]